MPAAATGDDNEGGDRAGDDNVDDADDGGPEIGTLSHCRRSLPRAAACLQSGAATPSEALLSLIVSIC